MPSDGELFLNACAVGFNRTYDLWDTLPNKGDWELAAQSFIKSILPRFDLNDQDGRVYDVVHHRWLYTGEYLERADAWKPFLLRYGRHHPNCTTGAECICGFAEVEKRLNVQRPDPQK